MLKSINLFTMCMTDLCDRHCEAEPRPQHGWVPSETPRERFWERSRPLANGFEGLLPTEWRKSSSGNSFWACGDAKQWPTVLRGASATGFRSSPPRSTVLSSDREGPPERCRCLDPSWLRQSSDGDGRKGARQKWHGDRQTARRTLVDPGL